MAEKKIRIPRWILRSPTLTAMEKLLWIQIKVWKSHSPGQNPSRADLAADYGLSLHTMCRALKNLEEAEALTLSENIGNLRRERGAQEITLLDETGDVPLAENDADFKKSQQATLVGLVPKNTSLVLAETVNKEVGVVHRVESTSTVPVRTSTVRTTYPPRFENFWTIYPRKKDKKKTLTWWMSHHVEQDAELYGTIISGLHRYIESCQNEGTDGKYFLHPSTFLRNERYLDDVSPPQATLSPQTQGIISASHRFLQRHKHG
jgi:hypothetical protein